MPIKPENKSRYPKDWNAITAEVRKRAGDCCEWEENGIRCNIPNGKWGIRDLTGKWWASEQFMNGEVPEGTEFERDSRKIRKAYKIVLTVAHLDHNPENNGEPGNRPNLRAWCQYHHLRYDHQHHMENARRTRNARKGQLAMPLIKGEK
jgi:hypothetical protein